VDDGRTLSDLIYKAVYTSHALYPFLWKGPLTAPRCEALTTLRAPWTIGAPPPRRKTTTKGNLLLTFFAGKLFDAGRFPQGDSRKMAPATAHRYIYAPSKKDLCQHNGVKDHNLVLPPAKTIVLALFSGKHLEDGC
jgi:hypothetical protein